MTGDVAGNTSVASEVDGLVRMSSFLLAPSVITYLTPV